MSSERHSGNNPLSEALIGNLIPPHHATMPSGDISPFILGKQRAGGNVLANMQAMQMLRDLAQRSSDKAVEDLGHLRRQQQDAESRLSQLQRYRDEYQRQLHDNLSKGVPSSQWRDYQQFLGSLDNAIEQQRRLLGEQQIRVDHGVHRWRGELRKLNAYDTLHARGEREQVRRQARHEQRNSDEMAAQLRRRQQDSSHQL